MICCSQAALAVALFCAMALPELPDSNVPNSEVSTNIVLSVDRRRLGKLSITLELNGSASNEFDVAIGNDADADGALSLEEADFIFGYDCGVWFRSDSETGVVTTESAATEGALGRTLVLGKREFNPSWNLLRLTRRGFGAIDERAEIDEEHVRFFIRLR